ncbi:MAG: PKD domain-containing protein [Bacteroidales bacterium]|nr:PKD domain-containing protein [Bacteroidales bacterium]
MKKNVTLFLALVSMLLLFNVASALDNKVIMANASADFQSNVNLVSTGSSVNFIDLTTGSPVSWTWTFAGGTPATFSGKIPPPIYYNAPGQYSVTLEVSDSNGEISVEIKPAYIEVMDFPEGWDVIQTASSHLISVPLAVQIIGDPLSYGDFLGVFYLDENSSEKCGGFTIWDGSNSKVVTAFGDDITTSPEKDGFSVGETMNWKVFFTATLDEKIASVTYNAALPNNNGTYADNGLSSLTQIFTGVLEASAAVDPSEICVGTQVQLSANASGGLGVYTYNWSSVPSGFSSSLADPVAYPAQNTTYTVVVNDGVTNVNSSVDVTVHPAPTAAAGSDQSICVPATVSLSGQAQNYDAIQWITSGSGTFQNATLAVTSYYPSANDITAGSVVLTLNASPIDPCLLPASDALTVTIEVEPGVSVVGDQSICQGESLFIEASAENYCGLLWLTDGDGTFDNPSGEDTEYFPGVGDIAAGTVNLCLTADACSPCVNDAGDCLTLTIQKTPVVAAGNDVTICETSTLTLAGVASNSCGLLWETDGDGTFSTGTTLNSVYYPGVQDIAIGVVELCLYANPCDPCAQQVLDCLILSIQKQPTAMAGADITICEGESIYPDASADNYCDLIWATDGDGLFSDASTVSAGYFPGTGDIDAGEVELCITAYACDPCLTDAVDCLTVTIQKSPSANAGSDASFCENENIILSGVAENYCDLTWITSGDGSFSSSSIVTPQYFPGSNDIQNGQAELCLTAQACDPCLTDAFDCVQIFIQKQPTASAGSNITICEGEMIFPDASADNYCDLLWTTTGDGSFEDAGTAATNYTPGISDIAGGGVELCLTAYACDPCLTDAVDCLTVTIQKSPSANAGSDASFCENENIILSGVAQNYCDLTWTTSGDGSFSSVSIETPQYLPGSNDIQIGQAELCLTAQACDPCLTDAFDCVQIFIQKQPTASAGSNITICEGEMIFPYAFAENYCDLLWTTTGDGSFEDAGIATTNYTPGTSDIAGGGVELCLTAYACDPCLVDAHDCINVTIQKAVSAEAGSNATICEGDSYLLSDADAANFFSIGWGTNGSGTFNNSQVVNPEYFPSTADLALGCITLELTAQPVNPCLNGVVDNLQLCFQAPPTVNAGSDASLCEDESYYLGDAVAGNYSSLLWESDGDGAFDDATAADPTYTPGPIDLNVQTVTLTVAVSAIDPCTGIAFDEIQLSIQPKPIANAGDDATIPEDESFTNTDASVTNYSAFYWQTNGDGVFDDSQILHATYFPGNGDKVGGSVNLCLTAEPIAPCQIEDTDCLTLVIGVAPNVFAGLDASVCEGESYGLDQATAENYLSILWVTDGDGTFSDAGIVNPVYYPGTADTETGTAELCITAQPNPPSTVVGNNCMILTIMKQPAVNAGSDKTICEGATITLNETTASNYAQLQWSTPEGSGEFSNPNALKPTYTPGSSDYLLGCITLNVSALPNDPCTITASDEMELCFQLLPQAFAGDDFTICETENVQLSGMTENACGYFWETSGDGLFDNFNFLEAIYTPGTADIAAGTVTLCLTALPCNPCTIEDVDCLTIYLQPIPVVQAGDDAVICEDEIFTPQASVENTCSVVWRSTGNGQFSNPDEINTQYEPSPDDIENGEVLLCITGFPCDPCQVEAEDCMTLSIQKLPAAYAGLDATICEGESYLLSDASVENSDFVQWMVLDGNGHFEDETAVNTTYTPGGQDKIAGCVELILVAASISPCYAIVMDTMKLCIQKLPEVYAGEDNILCVGETLLLEAEATYYCGLLWSSDGDGNFGDAFSASTTYTPGPGDILAGGAELCLTADACNPCEISAFDCLNVSIQQTASAEAGSDATICEGEIFLLSEASAANYLSIEWSTSGLGTFSDAQVVNPQYFPSATDFALGCVTLELTAQPVNPCINNAVDDLQLCFQAAPILSAGSDVSLCEGEHYYIADAFAENYSNLHWASSGDGTFDDSSGENPTYYPGLNDLNLQLVTLTVTVSAINPCTNGGYDEMQIAIQPIPIVDAGADASIPEDETYTITDASASFYNFLEWTTTGDGDFDDNSLLYTTYTPGDNDISDGMVTLCIAAMPVDPCTAEAIDCMNIVIGAYPVVSAGADAVICMGQSYTFNDAFAQNYLNILWETSGDGTFSSATEVNPSYYPGDGDLLTGTIEICITAESIPPATGSVSDCITLTLQASATADAGPDVTLCEGQNFVSEFASASNYSAIFWSTSNGTGEFQNNGQVEVTYVPSFIDYIQGSITLQLDATSIDPCYLIATDLVVLTFQSPPQANAGSDALICEDGFLEIEGTVENACGFNWYTTFGDGYFDESQSLITVYHPGDIDKLIGFVEICLDAYPCDPCTLTDTDCLVLTIQANPMANAGADGAICENENYLLGGTVENACGALWETRGDGLFDDPALLNATYTPGQQDLLNGEAELCLSALPCNPCTVADSDCMFIDIQKEPVVNAGNDATICESETYPITGVTANHFQTILWTSTGSGYFSNANALNPEYYPSTSDILLGCITLEIYVTAIDPCNLSANDQVALCFQKAPQVDAGNDAAICSGETFATQATSSDACGYLWSTDGDGQFDDNTLLNAVYSPGSNDLANEEVQLCITAAACNPCEVSANDCMTIFIQALPFANAGPDDGVLAGNTHQFENASAANYSSLLWETQGDGLFDNPMLLNPAYTPGEGDINNYEVELCLNALPKNPCQISDQDCMILQIGSMPVITAGPDASVCSMGEYFIVDATAENYEFIQWSTSGDGTFDDVSAVNPVYYLGPADFSSQTVELCMFAEPVPPATISANDCMTLSLVLEPFADAGEDVTFCGNQSYTLQALANDFCEIEWTSTGDGAFNDAALLQPSYTPGPQDMAGGSVDLCISAIPCDPCTMVAEDCMTMFLFTAPTANAGNNITICENKTATLNGSVANNCGFHWETQGDGTFSNSLSLSPVYTPGALDKTNGFANLCMIAEPCEPCQEPVSDCMTLTIQHLPQPNPGSDASICFGDNYQLNGSVESGCGFYWQAYGDGTFSNSGSLTATYNPGPNDYSNGSVQICMLAFPCSPCSNFSTECMTLSFVSDPSVDAGEDVTVCSTDPFSLQPVILDACGVVWETNGDGNFDDNTLANAVYTPGPFDVANGFAQLCVTGQPCGSCETPATDCMTIYYLAGQTADAGIDATICENETLTLQGSASNNCGIEWATSGDGTFSDIFDPDAVYTPGGGDLEAGFVTITLSALPCEPCNGNVTDNLLLTFVPLPFVYAGNDALIAAGDDYLITDAEVLNVSSFNWTSSGDGNFDNPGDIAPAYTPGAGDILSGTVEICITAQPISPCSVSASDCLTLSIVAPPSANAGPDATICQTESFLISEAVADNYSSVQWTTTGDGTFSNSNDVNPVYYPGETDISNGSAQLCINAQPMPPATEASQDCMVLYFQATPLASAGEDATICGETEFPLSGFVENACGFEWTANGDGIIGEPFQLITNYTPGTQDMANGNVTICLTALACNPCLVADVDCLTLSIAGEPLAVAGNDQTICEEVEYVQLDGSAQNVCGYLWTTSGTGTFDNFNLPDAKYYPGDEDIIEGSVELCFEVEACDPCSGNDMDCMAVEIVKLPLANAGDDWTICENTTYILQGMAQFNCGVSWYTLGDGNFAEPNNPNSEYIPGAADIEAGFTEICLEAYGCEPCGMPDTDCMILYFAPLPEVNAGPDATVCENQSYTLQANVENGCGMQWISMGTGFFDNENIANATYTPGILDLMLGSVDLCLISQPCFPCSSGEQDCVTLYFAPLPEVNAGSDVAVCEGGSVQLDGFVNNACASVWTSSGDGEFNDPSLLNATYSPGTVDALVGTVELCLVANACQPCSGSESDCLTITVQLLPEAFAGDDATICEGDNFNLFGQVSNACNWLWTSTGDGEFDDAGNLFANYTPGAEDILNGNITLCLTAGPCDPCTLSDEDCMTLYVQAIPVANAGDDLESCDNVPVQLSGQAGNYSMLQWESSGDGVFDNSSLPDPVYTPGENDKINAGADLTLIAVPLSPCLVTVSDATHLNLNPCQSITIPQGWSGISSWLEPADQDLELMFAPILNELVILQTMQDSWWPAEELNTIGNWDVYQGYKIKVSEEVTLSIPGTLPEDKTISLNAGWNLIPVLSACDVNVEDLFLQTDVVMVKEVAGWKIFWPELGINNLVELQSGKAYYAFMASPGAVLFPDCDGLKTTGISSNGQQGIFNEGDIPAAWETFTPTALSHVIGIPAAFDINGAFAPGDVIGMFDVYDNCYGVTVWIGDNTFINAFADDPLTAGKDGFLEGETISFRRYEKATGTISELQVEFNNEYPANTGNFVSNAISLLKSGTVNAANISLVGNDALSLYPNPIKNRLIISLDNFDNVRFELMNLQGQTIFSGPLTGIKTELDFSGMTRGVYLVHVYGTGINNISRIVKQ